jgi:hypothetical protein
MFPYVPGLGKMKTSHPKQLDLFSNVRLAEKTDLSGYGVTSALWKDFPVVSLGTGASLAVVGVVSWWGRKR